MLNDKHGPIGKALQVRSIPSRLKSALLIVFSPGHSTGIPRSVIYGRSARYATMSVVLMGMQVPTVGVLIHIRSIFDHLHAPGRDVPHLQS